jgi:hypothetical protein
MLFDSPEPDEAVKPLPKKARTAKTLPTQGHVEAAAAERLNLRPRKKK